MAGALNKVKPGDPLAHNVYDAVGHLTHVYRSDGTHASRDWGCCAESVVVDGGGLTTQFSRDALGRVTWQQKDGIGTSTDPDYQPDITTETEFSSVSGYPVITETTSAGSMSLATQRKFDRAGRVIWEQDAAGLQTSFGYGTASDGGRSVTTTRPGGQTETTEYYRDGRVKRVYGSAGTYGPSVVSQAFAYGANSDGTTFTRVITGSDNLSLISSHARYSETVYDGLGRVKLEKRPAVGGSGTTTPIVTTHSYNTLGQLVSTTLSYGSTALVAPMLYEYDDLGARVRSGLDVDGSGTLYNASADRYTETATEFVSEGSPAAGGARRC